MSRSTARNLIRASLAGLALATAAALLLSPWVGLALMAFGHVDKLRACGVGVLAVGLVVYWWIFVASRVTGGGWR